MNSLTTLQKANDVWIARIELIPAASGSDREDEDNEVGYTTKDPSIVRELALDDARHGRYEQALEKTLWYWDKAVQIQPSLSAVRRSFLLSDWLQLGEVYPSALAKMRSVRDQLQQRISLGRTGGQRHLAYTSSNEEAFGFACPIPRRMPVGRQTSHLRETADGL